MKIWPLSVEWEAKAFSKFKLGKIVKAIPCPMFGLTYLSDRSDEMIVGEIERKANTLLRPYSWKEHKAFLDCCPHGSRVN